MEQQVRNRLPMPTWNFLGVNETSFESADERAYTKEPALSGVKEAWIRTEPLQAGGRGHTLFITIPKGVQADEPLILPFLLDQDDPVLKNAIHLVAEEGSRATVVITYRSLGDEPCTHEGETVVDVRDGAEVKLIQAQLLQKQDRHADQITVTLGENAKLEAVLCELGSRETVAGCHVRLAGKGSEAAVSGIYMGGGAKTIDLNEQIVFAGEETVGNIMERGALFGGAKKVMKSTLNFQKGAAGAKGREEETVLALSERVVNLSVPLLLCEEDDVEGEHATSTGRPDEKKLFYMMSRGVSEAEARKLLVKASFTPILQEVTPEALREELARQIEEVLHD